MSKKQPRIGSFSDDYSSIWDVPVEQLPKRSEELWPTCHPHQLPSANEVTRIAERPAKRSLKSIPSSS